MVNGGQNVQQPTCKIDYFEKTKKKKKATSLIYSMHDTKVLDYVAILIVNKTYSVLVPCKEYIESLELLCFGHQYVNVIER